MRCLGERTSLHNVIWEKDLRFEEFGQILFREPRLSSCVCERYGAIGNETYCHVTRHNKADYKNPDNDPRVHGWTCAVRPKFLQSRTYIEYHVPPGEHFGPPKGGIGQFRGEVQGT